MVRVVRLERTVSWSQTRRDTNFAIPGYSISAMIPRRGVKIKFFLSVVIPVVKATFVPLSATGESPANAGVARLCGVSPHPIPDTTTALPKQARYQLRYTRLFSFLSGWAYSPKPGAIPTSLYPDTTHYYSRSKCACPVLYIAFCILWNLAFYHTMECVLPRLDPLY